MINPKPKPIKKAKTKKPRRLAVRKRLERKADALCKQIVLLRDGFCVCPAPRNGHSIVRQPGHLITRSKESVRWSLLNVNEQCSSCNLVHEFSPERYTNWFIQKFGAEAYAGLVAESEEVHKLTLEELEELLRQLEDVHSLQLEDKTFKPYFSQKQLLSGEWKTIEGLRKMSQMYLGEMKVSEAA